MKNNALTKEEKKDFILRYKPDRKGNLWVWRPNGKDKMPLKHTPENIAYLNQKMKSQVKEPNKKKHMDKSNLDGSFYLGLIILIIGFGLIDLTLIGFSNILNVVLISEVLLVAGVIVGPFISAKQHKEIVNDITKYEEFIPLEPVLNDAIKTNSVVLSGINKFTVTAFINAVNEYTGININTMDKCSLEDLRRIKQNIDIYKMANESCSEETTIKDSTRVL